MNKGNQIILFTLLLAMLFSMCARKNAVIYGTWEFNKKESTDVVTWRYRIPQLKIEKKGEAVTLTHNWQNRRNGDWVDSITITPNGEPKTEVVESAIWPGNWYMGVLSKIGSEKTTKASWKKQDRTLVTEIQQVVEVSQGDATISSTFEYAVNWKGNRLTLTEKRSTRPTAVKLVFDRVVDEAEK